MSNTSLPWVSSNIPPDLRQFLERVRETLNGDTYVRRVDYLQGTVPRNPTDPPGPYGTPVTPTTPTGPCGTPVTPTTPTGFEVAAGFTGFLLTWDMPGYCGHSHTEVYGLRRDGTSAELDVQNMLGESRGVMYSHVVNKPEDYWCFWIKHVNSNDVAGPFVGAGVCAKTALDPQAVIEVLTGKITETELYQDLARRIELIDVNVPLSRLVASTSVKNAVFYQDCAPGTGCPGEPADLVLVPGDLWFDTSRNDLLHRYVSPGADTDGVPDGWMAVPPTAYGTLQTQITDERSERITADTAEAYTRESVYAAGFAGIGNSYKHFVQDPTLDQDQDEVPDTPTASQVGDVWAWKTATLDLFKRWSGTVWVQDPAEPPADFKRAAKYWGQSATAPTGGTYRIGDIYLNTSETVSGTTDKLYPVKVYNGTGWQTRELQNPDVAAFVESEKLARVDSDGALSSKTDLVYARLGNTRPNLCRNGNFEDGLNGVSGGELFFIAESGWGRYAVRVTVPDTTGSAICFPRIPIYPGATYSISGDAVVWTSGGTGYAYFDLLFTDAAGTLLKDGTQRVKSAPFDFSDDPARRDEFAAADTAPPGAAYAIPRFVWGGTNLAYVGVRQVQVVQGGLIDGKYMPPWSLESTSAMVADVATARIGYCSQNGTTTADGTKEACLANGPGYVWNTGMPWATAVKQVSVTADGQTATVQQSLEAIYGAEGLRAQYTVKIDAGGKVAGFGLASEPVAGGDSLTSFGVRADRFYIAAPASYTGGDIPDTIPFIVNTTQYTDADGNIVPVGVYLTEAYIKAATITGAKIKNATIDSAKIASLSANKITAGRMRVDSYIASSSFDGDLSTGAILTNGTNGWAIDHTGKAVFRTVHLADNAVSEMQWVPPEGTSAPELDIRYPAAGTYEQWSNTKSYAKDAVVWYISDRNFYQCKVATYPGVAPTNVTFWKDYGYVDLAVITVSGNPFGDASSNLGMVFFARGMLTVDVPTTPATDRYANPITREVYTGYAGQTPGGDVAIRLVREDVQGTVKNYAAGGITLAYVGRPGPVPSSTVVDTRPYRYCAFISPFEYVSALPGKFMFQAKSLIANPNLGITANSIYFGYIGMKR